jgi:hypothetical protein
MLSLGFGVCYLDILVADATVLSRFVLSDGFMYVVALRCLVYT